MTSNCITRLALGLLLLSALAGCGQKGPLYLPSDDSGNTPTESQS